MCRPRREAAFLVPLLALTLGAWTPPPPAHTEVAPGVHLFQTQPYGDVGLDGNSVAIVSDDGVLVFDANGTPAAARAVLAQIRRLTKQPVRYLVYSHWHWDHWYGAEVYAAAFRCENGDGTGLGPDRRYSHVAAGDARRHAAGCPAHGRDGARKGRPHLYPRQPG